MCIAEHERDQWRNIIDETAAVLHPGQCYNSASFPQEVAALLAERDSLRVEVERLRAGSVATEPPDNAALRQRVYEHIGNLILNEKAGWGGLPDLVAQFDLLGRDL